MPKLPFQQLQVSAVIFDWDKTLAETMEGIRIATNYALDEMAQRGFKVPVGETDRGYAQLTTEETQVRFSAISRDFFNSNFKKYGPAIANDARNLWLAKMEEVHLKYTQMLEGAIETIKDLRDKGVPVCIVSNKDQELLEGEVAHTLGPLAKKIVVIGALDGYKGKPYPEPLFEALRRINVASGKTVWMVGDSVSDIKAGIKSGSYPILYSSVNCAAIKTLQKDTDPETKTVVSGEVVGFARDHKAMQKIIASAIIVPAQPYDPARNPHYVCKHPQPKPAAKTTLKTQRNHLST